MTKTLIKHGNSAALVIDKPIMDLLNITSDTPLEITTDGTNIILSPQTDKTGERDVLRSLDKINAKFKTALKKLGE